VEALASFFKFHERGTTFGTEVRAGITTFMVMVYIVAVNPLILSAAGIDAAAAAAATALVAAVMTILMGIVANVPLALAAGLGINGIVAFGLILGAGLTPAGAMGVIVLEGLAITVLVLAGLREAVMDAVPMALKRAIAVGIGLFILFIGFVDGGLIVGQEGPVPVAFVFPNSPAAWVTLSGLAITIILYARKVPAALIISIVLTSVVAYLLGVSTLPDSFSATPNFSTLGQFDFSVFDSLPLAVALLTIFTIMLADFFDTMGTATAITEQAGLMTEDGKVPQIRRLLLVDSLAAVAGGAAGISSNTSYIESAAGVSEGGRTGFSSIVVGLLFAVMILFSPLVALVPLPATAAVLILVGFFMVSTLVKDIDFTNFEDGFPALLAMILMPLTFNITVGIGAAFIVWVFIKVILGKFREVHWLMWIVSLAFLIYFLQEVVKAYI
jgi:AGZA family xanthine/uracil permease-like MFS transporter